MGLVLAEEVRCLPLSVHGAGAHTEAVIIPRVTFKHWRLINTSRLNSYILVSRAYGKALSLMFTTLGMVG